MKKRRMDLGLLQKDVAVQLGVDKATVANWEKGKTQPVVRYLPGIIRFLGYNPLPPAGHTFQQRLNTARRERGLSWKRLARELGVWETTVRDWENGTHYPTKSLYDRLCRFLELR